MTTAMSPEELGRWAVANFYDPADAKAADRAAGIAARIASIVGHERDIGPVTRTIAVERPDGATIAGYEQRAPAVPPETCPLIDEALGSVHHGLTHLSHAQALLPITAPTAVVIGRAMVSIGNLNRILEQLRTTNEALRRSGAYWHKAAREIAAMAERTDL